MNNQRALATIGVATMIALAIPGIAAATVATATPSCTGLAWSVTHYSANVTNTIVVKVDGGVVYQDANFGASDVGSVAWSPTGHTWAVKVDAPGTTYDKYLSGTWQPCVTTTTTVPSSTTVVVTTTVPPSTSANVATTVVIDTTTTSVAVGPPPVPTTIALGVATPDPTLTPDEPVLPRTGGVPGFAVAIGLLLLGGVFAFTARRRVG